MVFHDGQNLDSPDDGVKQLEVDVDAVANKLIDDQVLAEETWNEVTKKYDTEGQYTWIMMYTEAHQKYESMLVNDLVTADQFREIWGRGEVDPFQVMANLTDIEYAWRRNNLLDNQFMNRNDIDTGLA